MKSQDGITVASMAIFVLMCLGIVAYFYYQNQHLKEMLIKYQATSSPIPMATIEASASPSASLKPIKTPVASASGSIKY